VPDKTRDFPGFDPPGLLSLNVLSALCARVVPRRILKENGLNPPRSAIFRSIFAVLSDFSIIFFVGTFG
jgi:hypothetical protein